MADPDPDELAYISPLARMPASPSPLVETILTVLSILSSVWIKN